MTDSQEGQNGHSNLEIEVRRANNMPLDNLMLTDIIAISRCIPEDVNSLDAFAATDLANKFLKGQDMCGELLSLAISYELKMSALTDATFSEAVLVRARAAGINSATERKIYGSGDEQYLAANNNLIRAKMFRSLLEEKRNMFGKAHHLMKSLITKDNQGFDSDTKSKKLNATEWTRTSSWQK